MIKSQIFAGGLARFEVGRDQRETGLSVLETGRALTSKIGPEDYYSISLQQLLAYFVVKKINDPFLPFFGKILQKNCFFFLIWKMLKFCFLLFNQRTIMWSEYIAREQVSP